MHVEQISIFIENKFGRLAEVTRVLGDAGINIRTLSLADTSDFGILRLIVNDTDKAKAVLKEKGFTVNKTEVVAVEIPDRPGGLADILQVLDADGINVEYMYAFTFRSRGWAVLVFRFEDPDAAVATLKGKGVQIVSSADLYSMVERL